MKLLVRCHSVKLMPISHMHIAVQHRSCKRSQTFSCADGLLQMVPLCSVLGGVLVLMCCCLCQIEELEENYALQQQLREGWLFTRFIPQFVSV